MKVTTPLEAINTTTPRTLSFRQREADSYIDPDLRDALERIAELEAQVRELTARLDAQEAGK